MSAWRLHTTCIERSQARRSLGTLIIDVIDPRQKRFAWCGSGEQALGEEQTPAQQTKLIDATVDEILSRFPPASNKPR